jgi:hypothetical protein
MNYVAESATQEVELAVLSYQEEKNKQWKVDSMHEEASILFQCKDICAGHVVEPLSVVTGSQGEVVGLLLPLAAKTVEEALKELR